MTADVAREVYITAAGSLTNALDFEQTALSAGREFLPDFAIDRLDGSGDPKDDVKYYEWLAEQLKGFREPLNG